MFYKSNMPLISAYMFGRSFLLLYWGILPLKDSIVLTVLDNISRSSMGLEMNNSTIDILWSRPDPGLKAVTG